MCTSTISTGQQNFASHHPHRARHSCGWCVLIAPAGVFADTPLQLAVALECLPIGLAERSYSWYLTIEFRQVFNGQ